MKGKSGPILVSFDELTAGGESIDPRSISYPRPKKKRGKALRLARGAVARKPDHREDHELAHLVVFDGHAPLFNGPVLGRNALEIARCIIAAKPGEALTAELRPFHAKADGSDAWQWTNATTVANIIRAFGPSKKTFDLLHDKLSDAILKHAVFAYPPPISLRSKVQSFEWWRMRGEL